MLLRQHFIILATSNTHTHTYTHNTCSQHKHTTLQADTQHRHVGISEVCVCFSVLIFQPNANTLEKAKPHYSITRPLTFLSPPLTYQVHTHIHTKKPLQILLKKTAEGNTARLHEGSVRGQLSAGWQPHDYVRVTYTQSIPHMKCTLFYIYMWRWH